MPTFPRQVPTKTKVQLNVKVPWDYREYLTTVAAEREVSLNKLINDALQTVLPMQRSS